MHGARWASKRKPQPKRYPEYSYEMSDDEYQGYNKQGRYDYDRPLQYSQVGSVKFSLK